MKVTDFRFELRVESKNPAELLAGLKAKLLALNGVNSVSMNESGGGIELSLSVEFENSDEAKKLHRKVMNAIIGYEGVSLSQVRTRLTDIF